jgi:LytS/YehU family sensor histidine kinase
VQAEETLVRLAGLFRYSLEGSRRPSVTLREELAIIRDYLELEGLRLGQRLKWELDADDALMDLRVPPLMLQPLVENAIIHGIAPRREGGTLHISVQADGDQIVLQVRDDGPGSSNHRGTGTALADLERRLEMSYRGEARVERKFDQEGHRVCIRLPKAPNLEWQ